eukprot:gnl/TRDRNA2_/TRDRNA2_177152_c1_seq5.p1 gnl/TRDRNA2_/TRDRNA2_177152_c1~~gnl/TRDRNA2_/TRDRNA2_177152_c1_seq5.p1  ORF type:complete len:128 (-),score=22.58 gnl/TRDRNA2_/TRDRNA2_177152_c1_seq5:72-455(-)
MMYQSLHRARVVKAWRRSCSSDTAEFETKYKTENQGLGIDVCNGESQHFGAALFQRGEYAMHELDDLAERHAADVEFARNIAKIRTRHSAREPDGCSLTLTQASQPSPSCRTARCRSMPPKRDHRRH